MNLPQEQDSSRAGMRSEFEENGYTVAKGLFSRAECLRALVSILRNRGTSPTGWYKEGAISNPGIFYAARSDRIVSKITELLGPDVILWGARLIIRRPRGIHPWHCDAESAGDGFASVWIGLTGTTGKTALKLIPGSHKYGTSIQQLAKENNVVRGGIKDEIISEWSRHHDAYSRIEALEPGNGDALIFDGRLWHGSNNSTLTRFRTSLLLQYAKADIPVRIPDNDHLWPWTYHGNRTPRCLVISGKADNNTNRIYPGPVILQQKRHQAVSTKISGVQTSHPDLGGSGFKSFGLIEGASPDLRYMESHYSALAPGASPHKPHSHDQEEILIVLEGEAELIAETAAGSGQFRHIAVKTGDFIFYPANWRHTLVNSGKQPVTYLMFKWLTHETHAAKKPGSIFIESLKNSHYPHVGKQSGMGIKIMLECQTRYLSKLHAHRTVIRPGRGYAAHADAYDLGIVLIKGKVETLGQKVEAPAFIYYAAGEMHGLKNIGDHDTDYIVFEFHGKHGEAYIPLGGKIAKAIRDPKLAFRFAKEKVRQLFNI